MFEQFNYSWSARYRLPVHWVSNCCATERAHVRRPSTLFALAASLSARSLPVRSLALSPRTFYERVSRETLWRFCTKFASIARARLYTPRAALYSRMCDCWTKTRVCLVQSARRYIAMQCNAMKCTAKTTCFENSWKMCTASRFTKACECVALITRYGESIVNGFKESPGESPEELPKEFPFERVLCSWY